MLEENKRGEKRNIWIRIFSCSLIFSILKKVRPRDHWEGSLFWKLKWFNMRKKMRKSIFKIFFTLIQEREENIYKLILFIHGSHNLSHFLSSSLSAPSLCFSRTSTHATHSYFTAHTHLTPLSNASSRQSVTLTPHTYVTSNGGYI